MVTESAAQLNIPRKPWEAEVIVPPKPEVWDYAYVVRGKAYGCTKEGLVDAVADIGLGITHVWIPESNKPVRPETLEFLLPGFQKRINKAARKSLIAGLALFSLSIVLAVGISDLSVLYRSLFGVFGALLLIEAIWEFYRAKSYSRKDLEAEVAAEYFEWWVAKTPPSIDMVVLFAAITVVGIAQILAGEKSIETAGLVKPAVWQGQVWRLATAPLMHANFTHFWVNLLSLVSLSRLLDRTLSPRHLTIIFFSAGVSGSILSVLLYPNTTSVGASGGLLGILGAVTVAVWLDQSSFPPRYLRRMIVAIVSIGVLGIVGFAIIDNAAHAGGLLCGGILGWVLLKRKAVGSKTSVRLLSTITLILIIVFSVFAIEKLLNFW